MSIDVDVLERISLLLMSALLLHFAFIAYPILYSYLGVDPLSNPAVVVAIASLEILGVILLVASLVSKRGRGDFHRVRLLLGLVGALALVLGYIAVMGLSAHYDTDAILYIRYAADLVLKGLNPYEADMSNAYQAYGLNLMYPPPTYSMNGSIVKHFSYPALSFLLYTPLVALGIGNINVLTVCFLAASFILLVLETPPYLYFLPVLLLLANSDIVTLSYAGAFDATWMFFVLLALRYFDPHNDRRLTKSAVFLGLACAVKQIPWVTVPFLTYLVWREAGAKKLQKFALWFAVSFLAPNAPFILRNPLAWLRGVLTPASQPLVPWGYSLSSLELSGVFSLPHTWFVLAEALVFTVLFILYILAFDVLKPLAWIAPIVVFAVGWRSLHSYFVYFVPIGYYALLKHYGAVLKRG